MKGNKKVLSLLTIVSLAVPVAYVNAVSSVDLQDGGIGKSTHFLDQAPNIAIDPKVENIIYPLLATPAIKKKGTSLTVQVDTKGKESGGWAVKNYQTQNSGVEGEC
jgi:hypothetical protein